jgi:hypothetical protein
MQSGTGSGRQSGPTPAPGFPPRNADVETSWKSGPERTWEVATEDNGPDPNGSTDEKSQYNSEGPQLAPPRPGHAQPRYSEWGFGPITILVLVAKIPCLERWVGIQRRAFICSQSPTRQWNGQKSAEWLHSQISGTYGRGHRWAGLDRHGRGPGLSGTPDHHDCAVCRRWADRYTGPHSGSAHDGQAWTKHCR